MIIAGNGVAGEEIGAASDPSCVHSRCVYFYSRHSTV